MLASNELCTFTETHKQINDGLHGEYLLGLMTTVGQDT